MSADFRNFSELPPYTLRPYRPSDVPQLSALWERIFGDPGDLVRTFYDLLPCMGDCCVATVGDRVAGMAHLIHGFTLLQPDQPSAVCGYLYAVAVDEAARGHGLGAALSRGAVALGREQGAERICTLPAEESLYRWYGDILSLSCRTGRTVYTAEELPRGCFRISAGEYGYDREDILFHAPHVELCNAAMTFEARLCEAYGGGLYRSEGALFCAMREGDGWVFPELLSFAPTADRAASPVFPPDALPEGFHASVRPWLASETPFPDGLLWNLTFD